MFRTAIECAKMRAYGLVFEWSCRDRESRKQTRALTQRLVKEIKERGGIAGIPLNRYDRHLRDIRSVERPVDPTAEQIAEARKMPTAPRFPILEPLRRLHERFVFLRENLVLEPHDAVEAEDCISEMAAAIAQMEAGKPIPLSEQNALLRGIEPFVAKLQSR